MESHLKTSEQEQLLILMEDYQDLIDLREEKGKVKGERSISLEKIIQQLEVE